jgi:hypothetical protein
VPAPATATATTARLIRLARWRVGVAGRRGPVWRGALLSGRGELLEPTGGFEQLLTVDVGVARDGREVGVAKVLGDEPRVPELLAEPRRSRVAERVRGDVLLELGALRRAADDVGEDRLLQPSALEATEDGSVGSGF